MSAIKPPYTRIVINISGVTLLKDDGTTSFIPLSEIGELSLEGAISGGNGDQDFFDEYDPSGEQIETPIIKIAKYWKRDYIDCIKARTAMYVALVTVGGFDNLTEFEKKIISRWFLAVYDQRISVVSDSEDEENWDKFLLPNTKKARDKRIEAARRAISYSLVTADATDIYNSTADYIAGFSIANTPDLLQWITNTAPYENDGFAQKSYYTVERKDLLVGILKDGNYTNGS